MISVDRCVVLPLAAFTRQDWFWSGGLIEISLILAVLLGTFWFLNVYSRSR